MTERKSVIRETDAEAVRLAKTLIRTARFGALAVLDRLTGAPAASRVAVATETDGTPLILISTLSAHTSALAANPLCSLLLGEPGRGDPLAYPRISLSCRAMRLESQGPAQEQAEWRYLNRHPKARLYGGFADFSFFRLDVIAASLNGGFGKAYRLDRRDMILGGKGVATIAAAERAALDHMNEAHGDAIAAYARSIAGAAEGGWTMTALDPEGFEIAAGDEIRRIFFAAPAENARQLRQNLVELAASARAQEKQSARSPADPSTTQEA